MLCHNASKINMTIKCNINFTLSDNYEIVSLVSNPTPEVLGFIHGSPEFTVYHSIDYINFSKKYNNIADILLIKKSGRIVLAFPLHSAGYKRYTTGYSGILFPNTDNEKILKESVRALFEFIKKNQNICFEFLQSTQSMGGLSKNRRDLIALLLARKFDLSGGVYTRILNLKTISKKLDTVEQDAIMRLYDSKIRNQIRSGLKKSSSISLEIMDKESGVRIESFRELHPLLVECRKDTGMGIKNLKEWIDEARAIIQSSGKIIISRCFFEGALCAFSISYVSRCYAIYWMGCSNVIGKSISSSAICLNELIQAACRNGVEYFEIGRTDYKLNRENVKEMRITDFKDQFGGEAYWIIKLQIEAKKGLMLKIESISSKILKKLLKV